MLVENVAVVALQGIVEALESEVKHLGEMAHVALAGPCEIPGAEVTPCHLHAALAPTAWALLHFQ